jgi:hypothetical protein
VARPAGGRQAGGAGPKSLDFEFGPRSEAGPNRRKEANNASTHIDARYQPKTRKLNRYKVYRVFGRDSINLGRVFAHNGVETLCHAALARAAGERAAFLVQPSSDHNGGLNGVFD